LFDLTIITQKIPTIFNINASGLGFLDPSSGKDVSFQFKNNLIVEQRELQK